MKLTAANQQLYGLVGLRRKLPPGQYFVQTPVHHGPRMPQGATPPLMRTLRTTSPPMNINASNVPQATTPPVRTEGLVTNVSTRPLSPSLPEQRHDVVFPNVRSTPQPGSIKLPTRFPTNTGPAPRPSVMSASEYLGSLVVTRFPGDPRNSITPNIPSAPSNLVPSAGPTVTLTNPGGKVIEQPVVRLPDLVTGVANQAPKPLAPKTDGLPTARMPDVVSGGAGTVNGDNRHGVCAPPSSSTGTSDTSRPKVTVQSQTPSLKSNESVKANPQEPPGVVKKDALVNGTAKVEAVLKPVVNVSQAKVSAVNG